MVVRRCVGSRPRGSRDGAASLGMWRMSYSWLSYIATTYVLIGVYLISKPLLRGQVIMLAADTIWLTYALLTSQYALAAQSAVLFCISASAIPNWRRAGIKF